MIRIDRRCGNPVNLSKIYEINPAATWNGIDRNSAADTKVRFRYHPQKRRPFVRNRSHNKPCKFTMSATDMSDAGPKAQLDALLLKLHGVSARKINGLDAYFVSDRMFACIHGTGVGLRLPATVATELHFSRDHVSAFQPGGIAGSREWIQIERADAADYTKDLELFQTSIDFVKSGGRAR